MWANTSIPHPHNYNTVKKSEIPLSFIQFPVKIAIKCKLFIFQSQIRQTTHNLHLNLDKYNIFFQYSLCLVFAFITASIFLKILAFSFS